MKTLDKDKIFEGDNPFEIFQTWMLEAKESELNDPDAIALATANKLGIPNVRMVLLRFIEKDSFVFFSNYNSTKGQEILENNNVAFVCHWKSLKRQVRVRGLASKEEGEITDSYFSQRSITSKLGAWASKQSQKLSKKDLLYRRVEELSVKFDSSIPRPKFWGGFRVKPLEVEFWKDGSDRLHDRIVWRRENFEAEWNVIRLYP